MINVDICKLTDAQIKKEIKDLKQVLLARQQQRARIKYLTGEAVARGWTVRSLAAHNVQVDNAKTVKQAIANGLTEINGTWLLSLIRGGPNQ